MLSSKNILVQKKNQLNPQKNKPIETKEKY